MVKTYRDFAFLVCLTIMTSAEFSAGRAAQTRLIDLQGRISDQHEASIVGAKVSLKSERGPAHETVSNSEGRFHFANLPADTYVLKVNAESFAVSEQTLDLTDSTRPQRLTVTLYPELRESVDVKDNTEGVALDSERAAGTKVLDEKALELLPDDPDQLTESLQLLATSSGSAPGQATVTVDGFLNPGRLPPKSAIREVRINPDLFSSEYDKAPYQGGRIEIYTKPGASAFRGSSSFNFNESFLNARDPLALSRPPSSTRRYGLQFGGPIVRKRSGFFLDFDARDIKESAIVNAVVLSDQFVPVTFVENVLAPKRLLVGSARADWQVNTAHTFVARFDFNRNRLTNQGIGGFDLPERAYNSNVGSQSLRLSETAVINPKALNEARLGVTFQKVTQRPLSGDPQISVPGAFTGGGATVQSLTRREWRIELADSFSLFVGRHNLKVGAQLFWQNISDARSDNFNGTFTFGGRVAPQLDSGGSVVVGPDGPSLVNISGLEQYRRTLLGLPGGVPTRFSITTGEPLIEIRQVTVAGFVQDEWRPRPDLLLSMGLRYEGQTNPTDKLSLAPRLGVAYSPDKKRLWVLRARAGMFYDRVSESLAIDALRFDGVRQRQFLINSPPFPDPLSGGAATDAIPTVWRIDPALRPPASIQVQVGFEHQLPGGWKIEASHTWSGGWASLRARNVNAPILSRGVDPSLAPRPSGVKENILQFESSGKTNGQVLFASVSQSRSKYFSMYLGYLLFDFHSDTDGPYAFPQSTYDLTGEWARPSWQSRHRMFLAGVVNLPWKLHLSPLLNVASGTPFNITTGRDNNGDGNFTDRPSVVGTADPRAVVTSIGTFDPTALNGRLPRNAATNPYTATLDLNLVRTFSLRGRKAAQDNRYLLKLSVIASNVFNHPNLFGTNGIVTSPYFGRANRANPARRVEVGLRFTF